MALDTGRRPQQPPMQFMHQTPVAPQFTNPWATQEQMNDAAANLQCLAKPSTIRSNGVPNHFLNGNPATLTSTPMRSIPTSDHFSTSNGMMPAYTSAEMSMPGSTAPSPTTAGATYMPPYSSSFELSQRQASLTDMGYRSRPDIDYELDSARGMVVMSQSRSRQDSTTSQFPSNHSTSSSVSSSHSFPQYYNGGSIDSSATEYSDTPGYAHDGAVRQPALPRTTAYVTSGATVPNQMMTTFSSKITSSTQKKHKCKICDKRFTRPSSLQTHTYSHTGEKPFVCEQGGCGRRFSVVSNLRRHKKVHQGKGIPE